MDKSTHEEKPYEPLQTNKKQFKIAVIFLTGYHDIFNVTNSNNKFFFKKIMTNEEDFTQSFVYDDSIRNLQGVHETKLYKE